MTCERALEILDAFVDSELDAVTTRDMEWHLQECAACARQLAARKAMQRSLLQHLPRYRAPEDLSMPVGLMQPVRENFWRAAAFSVAACLIVAIAVILWFLLSTAPQARPNDVALASWIVNNHLRSLQLGAEGGRLIEIASSDRHTVKPWFAGKLPFAPIVRDLTAQGFPLVGGRVEMIDREPAAALVYRRDKHWVSLIMWPASSPDSLAVSIPAEAGYHVIHWIQDGMNCWAVTDAETEELRKFTDAFRSPVDSTRP
jgi:anti-sigma factor RsiW